MKIYIHHDNEGRIKGLITIDAPDQIGMMLTPKTGVFVSELEDIKFKSKSPTQQELKDLVKSHNISDAGVKKTLKRK
jgi:hypothetical protein